jgi:hypothetical protein
MRDPGHAGEHGLFRPAAPPAPTRSESPDPLGEIELDAARERIRRLEEALLRHACNCGCPHADPAEHDPAACQYRAALAEPRP